MRGADRKASILDAAVARIVQSGLEGLRIRDVAKDVGINNATLIHHFPNKAALVTALVQRFLASFSVAGGIPDGRVLEDRLDAYVSIRRAQMLRDPNSFIVFNELMVLARRDNDVRSLMARPQAYWRDQLTGICRDAGLEPAAALERADRCRRELLGMSLELCVARPD
jgi:AcrR family transcriptional regulator